MSEQPSAPPVPPEPPAAPPGWATAPVDPAPASRRPLIAGVVGLLVGAVLVGVPMALLGGSGGGGFGGKGGGSALQAPGTLGGLKQSEQVRRALPGGDAARQVEQMATQDQKSTQNLSAAYSGAPAVVQGYADADMSNLAELDAVRAQSPDPYVRYEDTAMMQEARPVNQLVKLGPVSCVLINDFTAAGQTPDPETTHVVSCQRTGPGLTVIVRPGTGDLWHDPAKVAALVNSAWDALS